MSLEPAETNDSEGSIQNDLTKELLPSSNEPVVINFTGQPLLKTKMEIQLYMSHVLDVSAVVDTGASYSFLNRKFLLLHWPDKLQDLTICTTAFLGVNGSSLKVDGILDVNCKIEDRLFAHQFVIADMVEDALLGLDFLQPYGATWNWVTNKIAFAENLSNINLVKTRVSCEITEDLHIPAHSTVCCEVIMTGLKDGVYLCSAVDCDQSLFPDLTSF
jgi:hypothetical protein